MQIKQIAEKLRFIRDNEIAAGRAVGFTQHVADLFEQRLEASCGSGNPLDIGSLIGTDPDIRGRKIWHQITRLTWRCRLVGCLNCKPRFRTGFLLRSAPYRHFQHLLATIGWASCCHALYSCLLRALTSNRTLPKSGIWNGQRSSLILGGR